MPDGSALSKADQLFNHAYAMVSNGRDAAADKNPGLHMVNSAGIRDSAVYHLLKAALSGMSDEPMANILRAYLDGTAAEYYQAQAGCDANERCGYFEDCAETIRTASEELAEHFDYLADAMLEAA